MTLLMFDGVALSSARAEKPGNTIYWNNNLDLIVKTQTFKLPRIDYVLSFLDIRPGMTILDIGAGSGQQSYKLAQKLNGTGQVYATDIDPQLVAYIAAQARQRGLNNLQVVMVKKDGVDPFYGKHRYDLVLLYDVVFYLHDRVAYYRQMGKFLRPGGRVVVVDHEQMQHASFYRDDFVDWDGFISRLKQEPAETPFGYLRGEIQSILDQYPRVDDCVMEKVALFSLNKMGGSMNFFAHFVEGLDFKNNVAFTPEERIQALYMLHRLRLGGLPAERDTHELRLRQYRVLELLNKLLIIQHFRPYLSAQGLAPYVSRFPGILMGRERTFIAREFKAAGYKLEKESPLIPFGRVWIFTADR